MVLILLTIFFMVRFVNSDFLEEELHVDDGLEWIQERVEEWR